MIEEPKNEVSNTNSNENTTWSHNRKTGVAISVLVVVALATASVFIFNKPTIPGFPAPVEHKNPASGGDDKTEPAGNTTINEVKSTSASNVKKFASAEEFTKYLEKAGTQNNGYGFGGGRAVMQTDTLMNAAVPMDAGSAKMGALMGLGEASAPDRVSETNVQVAGIDEPDIVKTDGKQLFVSMERPYYYYDTKYIDVPLMGSMPIRPQPQVNTDIINALPVNEIKKMGKIDKIGELLLYKDYLIIFSGNEIFGFDVKDRSQPKEVWKIKLEGNGYLQTARLYKDKLYLVTKNTINIAKPCPYKPMTANGKEIFVPCTDIYHPIMPVSDVTTFNAFEISPDKGEVSKKLSFVASEQSSTVVYMSENNLYVTYGYTVEPLGFLTEFIKQKATDLVPKEIVTKIEKLQTYDIGNQSKMTEFQELMNKYQASLSDDDRLKYEKEIGNRMDSYLKEHKREIYFTGIAKIGLDKFDVQNTGRVAGNLVNQFALDEYKGNLRIATTIGSQGFGYYGFGGWNNNQDSANDVVVLGSDMKQIGAVENLGLTERIYSARFIKDQAYLVTFRQTDPFYVLDMKDPKNPKLKGELKIPGFSSYLHPLADGRILGVGQEDWKVKISLFDVSDPANPKEIDKYNLGEYWSEASSNHHAFLQDAKHGIFFLPAGQNGYVFSYKNDKLKMEKAISSFQAKRAVYINDYLFVVSQDKIQVLNENDWTKAGELGL